MTVHKTTAAATYRWLMSRGYSPIEILPQSKHPNKGEGWNDEAYTARADYFEQPNSNVGARLGRGGLRDVDIDCPEAGWYASRLLPQTEAVFGRKTAPDTHYLYDIPGDLAKFEAIDPILRAGNQGLDKSDPKYQKAAIIDFRSFGSYTVMPGSVHMGTGEDVTWSKVVDPIPARLEYEQLLFTIKCVAMCVLIERHMWLDGMRHDVCRMLSGVLYFHGFDLDTAETLIGLIMEKTGDDDQSRLKTVRMTYKKADDGKKTEGATKLRTYLPSATPVLDKFKEWFKGENAEVLDEYNEKYAVVRYGGDVRIAMFDGNEPPEFLRKQAFFDYTMTDVIREVNEETGKLEKKAKSRIWWADHRRSQYSGVTFAPGVSADDDKLRGKLNLWRGWGVEPADCTWQEAQTGCRMWLDHLFHVICNQDQELYDWTISWFADIIKHPNRKSGTALCLVGGQGAGKTSVFQYFGKILGLAYVKVSQPNQLTGNFNSHFQNCLLLHAEEAVFARNHTSQSILKDMITSDTTALEKKGQDIVTIPSFFRVGYTSNSEHVIGADHDERRHTFINLRKRARDKSKKKEYDTERDGSGPANLFRYLLDCPDLNVDVSENFVTEELSSQKFQTADGIEAWWHETLNNGVLLHPHVNWCQQPAMDSWPHTASSPAIYASYFMWAKQNTQRRIELEVTFHDRLRKLIDQHPSFEAENKSRLKYMNPNDPDQWQRLPDIFQKLGVQQSTYKNIPDLQWCRNVFQEYAHLKDYKWEEAPTATTKVEPPPVKEPAPGSPAY